MPKVLHVLSQRPSRTGSGITLDAVVRQAEMAGWQQAAVVGIPAGDHSAAVGLLGFQSIHPVLFQDVVPGTVPPDLDFPVPGMSDVMPYPSSVWSTLSAEKLASYQQVWAQHLEKIIHDFQPDLIHSHHIWLLSSLLKDVAPAVPVITTCHATGLRQLQLCPQLAEQVIQGCRRNDHFLVLHQDHALQLAQTLNVAPQNISVTGVGFRDEIFHARGAKPPTPPRDLLYVGKFSQSKGLPWLLDAFEVLSARQPHLHLHIAGDGSGSEAETLRSRMQTMSPAVIMHGMLDQENLARLMRQCQVCILPSFYEGVPLVLVEAAACGCQLVSTSLTGVLEQIAPTLEDTLHLIPLPRLKNVDQPLAEDLPQFTENLITAITNSLNSPNAPLPSLETFTWKAVFNKVESKWQSLIV